MAQRISPTRIVTVTENGECHLIITMELNINLNTNGDLSASLQSVAKPQMNKEDVNDDVEYTIPDFVSGLKVAGFSKDAQDKEN